MPAWVTVLGVVMGAIGAILPEIQKIIADIGQNTPNPAQHAQLTAALATHSSLTTAAGAIVAANAPQ